MPTITISASTYGAMTKSPNPALTRSIQPNDDSTLSFEVDEDTFEVLRSIDTNIEAACRKARWIGLQALPPRAKPVAPPKVAKAPTPAHSAPKAAPKATKKPSPKAKKAAKLGTNAKKIVAGLAEVVDIVAGTAEPAKVWAPRAGSKAEAFVALLSRPQGATQDEIIAATGWVDNTIRGFLATLKNQHGIAIDRSKEPGGKSVYKIKPSAAADRLTGARATQVIVDEVETEEEGV